MNKLLIKSHAKRDLKQYPDVSNFIMKDPTPDADQALIKYLRDTIAWLDSLEEK